MNKTEILSMEEAKREIDIKYSILPEKFNIEPCALKIDTEFVKEIKNTDINYCGNDYLIITETGKEICIFEGQPGLQVIWENKND